MAIKVSNTTVIDDSRNITNVGTFTATSFVGDGSGLTNIPAGGSIAASGSSPYASAEDFAIINSDGTISKVSGGGTTNEYKGQGNFIANNISHDMRAVAATNTSGSNEYFVMTLFSDPSDGYYLKAIGAKYNSITESYNIGSPTTVHSGTTYGPHFDLSYDPVNHLWVCVYKNSSDNKLKATVLSVNSSNYNVSVVSTADVETNTHSDYPSITYNTNQSKWLVAFRRSDGTTRVAVGSPGSTVTFDSSKTSGNLAQSLAYISIKCDPTNNYYYLAGSFTSSLYRGFIYKLTFDGTTHTNLQSTALGDGANNIYSTKLAFDTARNKIVCNYIKYGVGVYADIFSNSTSTNYPDLEQSLELLDSNSIDYQRTDFKYAQSYGGLTNGSFIYAAGNYDEGVYTVEFFYDSITGEYKSAPRYVLAENDPTSGATASNSVSYVAVAPGIFLAAKSLLIYHDYNTSSGKYVAFQHDTSYTNMTDGNYIGVTATGGTNSVVMPIGSVITGDGSYNSKFGGAGQLTMVPGTKYYVKHNGLLTDVPPTFPTPTVIAGTAIASNKIILEG